MNNDEFSLLRAMAAMYAIILTLAFFFNLERLCKRAKAMLIDWEIAKLRRERLALLMERRLERNMARACRNGEGS